MRNRRTYDTIVVGGGHAGVEAAAAVSRMGKRALLLTYNQRNIGELSCNPSIGGVAKGIMVREVDALDGLMARCADLSGTHFKILNASRGPAVHSPRCQVDRALYRRTVSSLLSSEKNLDIVEGEVVNLMTSSHRVAGVILANGDRIFSNAVIVTTGTFLNGIIHIGHDSFDGGRIDEKPSKELAKFFRNHNFTVGRLKTGTPARLDGLTIDFSKLEVQRSDDPPKAFSYMTDRIRVPQVKCHITHTNKNTHDIIAKNLQKSALYGGKISGNGPRYCPSIEDKVVKFPDRDRHQVFLEAEDSDSRVIYPNGISTSLPKDVQEEFIHSIEGLENCRVLRYAYAIEYDYINPIDLKPTLETKNIENLFLAGQINGTTGYEEAAGQGIVAGINSVSKEPFILGREGSYIGVMIDDLTTRGTVEPYRMFTSRAEFRLFLRMDNADLRLTDRGIAVGCVSDDRKEIFLRRKNSLEEARNRLMSRTITSGELDRRGVSIRMDGNVYTAYSLLGHPNMNLEQLGVIFNEISNMDEETRRSLTIESIYDPYLERQSENVEMLERERNRLIPIDFNYDSVGGLTNEAREKFKLHRPYSIEVASRIAGITPANIVNIMIALRNLSSK
ncbi:MAG: tRNA uridine-5-carboxymethylaminomethyl(34) synthesis enzyme MnmG [Rickettsiales bacterium]|jgi:tRNA uridine 5-carboxymethylaminomethyl modification enzyme|nr:tRNA uridine-5-carboxymethylaminomethyl(34) synthesis enzyme MnmG [Rickettsiales bacterium]